MHRYVFSLACAAAIIACSDSGSPPADNIELSTDADTYEVISGVPLLLSITLRNNGTSSINATLCSAGAGVTTFEMSYQRRQGTVWVNIPYGQVDCGEEGAAQIVGAGQAIVVPAPFPPPEVPGAYRILVPWAPAGSTTTTTAFSNPFAVINNLEPTSNRAPH